MTPHRGRRSWYCQFHLRMTQLATGSSFGRESSQVGCKSLSGLVCKSVASHSWNVLSHANFCRVRQVTRGGRAQVVGRPPIGRKASQVSRRSVASVSRRSDRGCDSGAWVYADSLGFTNGVRARKSVVMRSQVSLITWPIIHFCILVCQSLPNIDVNASLRSNDKSLTTAHESKKSRIFQLVYQS